ncbi:MAG: glyceraldehyde-3-phosphate dehydrogenase [Caldilineaceae bacterium]
MANSGFESDRSIDRELTVQDSFPVLQVLSAMDLSPARVDLGKLTIQYQDEASNIEIGDFLQEKLAPIAKGKCSLLTAPRDVVLYGFGRIGRLLARILIERTGGGDKLRLRAIVVRKGGADDLYKRTSLLRRDSVHGPFKGAIHLDAENNAFIANGNYVKLIYADAPNAIDYTQYGIDNAVVVDNTGKWRDEAGLGLHLQAKGVSTVLLTAPGKGGIKNIVYGVNHTDLVGNEQIVSAASCTTNAIVPVLKAVNDRYGLANGHIETVHAYTNDQNLLDNYHKKERRGRGAPLNLVLTETGAASAVVKALPELAGKLTGNAIRAPIPNVSLAMLNLNLNAETSKDELNEYLRHVSLYSGLRDQIDFTASTEVVSSDLVGSPYAGIVDSKATIVQDNRCTLYVWYDNEAGYSHQVVRLMQHMTGLRYPSLPE